MYIQYKSSLILLKLNKATPDVNCFASTSAIEGHRFTGSFGSGSPYPLIFVFQTPFTGVYPAIYVRKSILHLHKQKGPRYCEVLFFYPSDALLSQAAARQVSSAPQSLTTVFGMGTGVSSALLSLSSLNTIHLPISSSINFLFFLDKPSAY